MSFQRRTETSSTIRGVRSGLVSTIASGTPQLDPILGGGIQLGSTLLLAEDTHNVYARHLMKAFISEGIAHDHRILIVDGESKLNLKELPKMITKETQATPGKDSGELRIAFRYERLPEHQSLPESQSNYVFDFGLMIEEESLQNADIIICQALQQTPLAILKTISDSIPKDNVLRVVATVGLLLDSEFMHSLKIISRNRNVVCWVSVPHCVDNEQFHRINSFADTSLSIVAFSSDERQANPLYKKHHGLLNVEKFAEINTIVGHRPSCIEYAFHQSSKKFSIEQLHMPPDLGEEPKTMSCSSSGGNRPMDF